MKRILVFSNMEQIGDGCIKLPFIFEIKKRFPNHHFIWATNSGTTVYNNSLKNIAKEYIDEINQDEIMDSAINGVLQSLDPYSAYMTPEMYENMTTETSGEFGGLGIEVGMEAGVVKVISPIDNTPASRAGVKAGDYIVKINDSQVKVNL